MAELNEVLPGAASLPTEASSASGAPGLLSRCGNPRCATGWLHLWRSRLHPRFEGKWACSSACMREMVSAAIHRELGAEGAAPLSSTPRFPLGLLLIEQGHLTPVQLHAALAHCAASADHVRVGEWLVASGLLSETALTHALGMQWSCPVFSLENHRVDESAFVVPRFLVEATGALPVRLLGGQVLYLAFAGTVDRSLSYGLERMLGIRVIAGIASDAEIAAGRARYFAAAGPRASLLEAVDATALAQSVAGLIERKKPVDARVVRIHDFFWVRMRTRRVLPATPLPGAGEDLLATIIGRYSGSG
jgi:hypothetical protein